MSLIGVLGGLGPAATVDFLTKLVALTPARCDQDHLPVLVLNQPHIPDRSQSILGHGLDPLPYLLAGIDLLNQAEVGLVVVPCNTAHHWFSQMAGRSRAPMLHIARACVDALPGGGRQRVAIFATRGAIASGVYQRELAEQDIELLIPNAGAHQGDIDDCIHAVKAGDLLHGSARLSAALATALVQGAQAVVLGCTELPVAAQHIVAQPLLLIDSTLELARQAVKHALGLGWHQPSWVPSAPAGQGFDHPADPSAALPLRP